MKKFLKVFAPIALGLGMLALACSSNNKGNPAAPSSPLPPTNTPCVDSQGHTCTPTVTATPTNTFTPTPTITPGPLNVTAPTTLTTGGYAFTTVDIGQALYINGAVTIDAGTYFNLPAGATIIGDGRGYTAGTGPGTSTNIGGGGHGGAGGASGTGSDAGPANDLAAGPTLMGSGGGGSGAGSGGGLLTINVPSGPATLDGFISMNGNAGTKGGNEIGSAGNPGSGGGAGGAIYVKAVTIVFNGGTLEAAAGSRP